MSAEILLTRLFTAIFCSFASTSQPPTALHHPHPLQRYHHQPDSRGIKSSAAARLSLPSGQSCTNPRPKRSRPFPSTPTPIDASSDPPFLFHLCPKSLSTQKPHRGRDPDLNKGTISSPVFNTMALHTCAACRQVPFFPPWSLLFLCNLATSVAFDATLYTFLPCLLETPWHATWNQSNQSCFGWRIFGMESRIWELAMPGVG
ncbi:hypothetical protein GGI35DRAFT_128520 [Trichoderma velutinum]